MRLTGAPLLVLLGGLVIGTPIATYALWSRLGRGAGWFIGRVGLLVCCQLSAVLLVGAAVNDYGYFYTSWSELFGVATAAAGPSAAATPAARRTDGFGGEGGGAAPDVGHASTRPAMRVLGDLPWSSLATWQSKGRIMSVELAGVRSDLAEHAYVYLPPQYYRPAGRSQLFPGVEVMTGYPGHEQSLVTRMHYPDQALAAVRAHRAQPMVLVMLRPSVTEPRDSECTDVPAGPQAMTFFSQDVPAAIESALRVRPTGWGIMGDSTGGYCATKIAMMRSDVFSAAVSFSGYYHALHDSTTGDLWGGSAVVRDLNDPLWRLHHLPEPPIGLFASIARGEGGPQGYHDTVLLQRAVAAAHGRLRFTCVVLPDGGHNFAAWSTVMPRAFSWLSAQLVPQA
jgi:hypothetical protein